MAASFMPNQPVLGVRTCASTSGDQKSNSQRRSWWTPLFGWSSQPDYIDSESNDKSRKNNTTSSARSASDMDKKPVRSRILPGSFTEEKARKLRMLTTGTESFHDAMYHSAIASRLASDFSDRSDL